MELVIHGRGNAWPVFLGEDHPFYNRADPFDLSNASFSLQSRDSGSLVSSVLIDAGHGTVQSLLSGDNRIPESISLTHGHMDHTLGIDWVVQSYWRGQGGDKPYPVYATLPVYRFMIRSYPHLEELTEHRELEFGVTVTPCAEMPFRLTAFPVYHGQSGVGASMLMFEENGRKVLFTGDLLVPMLLEKDYMRLYGADLMVVDTNNRFPWPRTKHWSFSGSPGDPMERSDTLKAFAGELSWEQVSAPHLQDGISDLNRDYLMQLEREWGAEDQLLTILEFIRRTGPKQVILVHYSGTEDRKHSGEEILSARDLQEWALKTAGQARFRGGIMVPEPRQRIEIN
jgi:glyoxylase-like metal-dependent hydrolase (beta-lactamase superfamily II)